MMRTVCEYFQYSKKEMRLPTRPEYTWHIIPILTLVAIRYTDRLYVIEYILYILFCGFHILAGQKLQL